MISPVQAIVWPFWRRNRWGFALSAAYLLAAAAIIQCLPPNVLALTGGKYNDPLVAHWLGSPCLFILLHILAVFISTDAGLSDSGYSKRMFVLPLETRLLVAGPMLAGCTAMLLAWPVIAVIVLRPAGANAPLLWPGAAAAQLLALLQVVSWTPLAQSWVRIALAIPAVLVPLAAITLKIAFVDFSEVLATSLFLLPIPAAYLAAVQAVCMARRGDKFECRAWERLLELINACRKPDARPFASAVKAQLWFEWRAHGWMLPVTLGSMVLLIAPLMVLADQTNLDLSWRFLAMLLAMPVLFAQVMGSQFGKQDVWSDIPLPSFLAARPISTPQLVRAKLLMCLTSTLAGLLLTLLGAGLLLLRPGFAAQVGQLALSAGLGKSLAIASIGGIGWIVITWLNMAASLWIGLTGRAWFVNVVTFAGAALFGAGTLAGVWIYFHTELHPYVWAAMPWTIAGLLTLKAVSAATVISELLRRRLVNVLMVVSTLITWGTAAGAVWLLIWWLAPSGRLPQVELAAGIALAVPFSRLAGAPLALDWNRHR